MSESSLDKTVNATETMYALWDKTTGRMVKYPKAGRRSQKFLWDTPGRVKQAYYIHCPERTPDMKPWESVKWAEQERYAVVEVSVIPLRVVQ